MKDKLIQQVYDRVTTDAAMKALFPGSLVAMHYRKAPRDAPMPYLVHRLQFDADALWAIKAGTHWFSAYDFADNAVRQSQIIDRLHALLDHYYFATTSDTAAFRMFPGSDVDVDTDSELVYRTDVPFYVRFFDKATATAALARP